jgi:CRP-like cAMP-binding protein
MFQGASLSKPAFSKSSDQNNKTIRALYSADLFRGVELSELGPFFDEVKINIYPTGSLLFTPGESSERLYVLRQGKVDLYRLTANGRRLITRQILPGSVFGMMGLLGQTIHGNFAETTEQSEICTLTQEDIMDLLRKRPDLALHIMEIVGNRLRLLEERLVEATYSPVKVRLAHFLLSNSDQTSGLLTNFTHEEIGDNIGALRQTVTEILGLMQKQRLILIRPRQIRIINRAEIENIIDND